RAGGGRGGGVAAFPDPGRGGRWGALRPVPPPQAPQLPDELVALLKRMRMPYLRKSAPEICATARAQRWDPAEVLRVLFAEEVRGRDDATRNIRRKAAGFPSGKTFGSWRPEDSSIPLPTQQALMTLEWVHHHENLAACGPSENAAYCVSF